MADFEALAALAVEEFPHLVVEVSGPWSGHGALAGKWIANFKDRDDHLGYIHAGSSGASPAEALEAGIAEARTLGGKRREGVRSQGRR